MAQNQPPACPRLQVLMSKVLIIEEDTPQSKGFSDALDQRGLEVRTAEEGHGGFEEILEFRPDAVLMNLNLPELSGLDILRGIRPHRRRMPLKFITYGSDDKAREQKAFRAGADRVLGKKPDGENILEAVREALSELEEDRRMQKYSEATRKKLFAEDEETETETETGAEAEAETGEPTEQTPTDDSQEMRGEPADQPVAAEETSPEEPAAEQEPAKPRTELAEPEDSDENEAQALAQAATGAPDEEPDDAVGAPAQPASVDLPPNPEPPEEPPRPGEPVRESPLVMPQSSQPLGVDEQDSIQTKRMEHPMPPRKAPQFQNFQKQENPAPQPEAEPEDSKQPVPQQDTEPEEQTLETVMPESENPSPEQENSQGQDLPKPPPNPQQRQVGGAGGQGRDTSRLLSKPPRITTSFKTTPIVPRKRPRDTSTFRPSMLPSAKPPKNLGAVKSVGSGVLPPAPGSSGDRQSIPGAPATPTPERPQGQRPVRPEDEETQEKTKVRTGRIQLPSGRLGQKTGEERQEETAPAPARPTPQSGGEAPEAVSLDIQSALSSLPDVDYEALPDQVPVAVPLDEVREQLKQGRVVLSAARLRELGGENLQGILQNVDDDEEINLPLREIVSQLPPEALALRPDQQVKGQVEDEEISKFRFEEAFGIKPEGEEAPTKAAESPERQEPAAQQQTPPPSPPRQREEPEPEPEPRQAAAEPEETARPAAGDKVSISVRSMAEQFPGYMDEDIPEDLRIDVPLDIVRHQLSRGRVSLTQEQARNLLPADQHHLLQELDEEQEINLPLRDVVEAIPPDQLSSGPRQTQQIPQVTSEPLFREYKGQDAEEAPQAAEAEAEGEAEAEAKSEPAPEAQPPRPPEPPEQPSPPGVSGDPVPPPLPPEALEEAKKSKGRPRPPLPFQRLTNIIVPRRKGASSDVDSEPDEEEQVEPLPKIPVAAPPKPKPAAEQPQAAEEPQAAAEEPDTEQPPAAEAPEPVAEDSPAPPQPPLPAAGPVKPLREAGSGMIHDDLMRTAKISLPSGSKSAAKRKSGRVMAGPETRVSAAGRMEKIRLKLPDVLKANLEDTPENQQEIAEVPEDIEIVLPAPVVRDKPEGDGWIISVRDFLDFVPDDYQKLFIIGYGSDEVVLPKEPSETEPAVPDAQTEAETEAPAPSMEEERQPQAPAAPAATAPQAEVAERETAEPEPVQAEAEAEAAPEAEPEQPAAQIPKAPSFLKPETQDAQRLKSLLSRHAGKEEDEEPSRPEGWKVPPVPKRPTPPQAAAEEQAEESTSQEEQAPVSRAEPEAVSDAAEPAAEEEPESREAVETHAEPESAPEPEPEPATRAAEGEEEEEEQGERTLALSLPPILEANFGSCPDSITAEDRVVVPLNTVRHQLSRGRVTLPFQEFLRYLSPLHQQAIQDLGEADEIKLPLQEIFKTLPPDALKVEAPRQTVPVDESVQTPFLELARQDQEKEGSPEDAEPEEETPEEPRKLKLRSAPVPPLPKVQGKQADEQAEEEREPAADRQESAESGEEEIKPPGPMPDYIQDATRTVRFGMTPMPRFRPAVTPNMEAELSREKERKEEEEEDHPAKDLLAEVRKAPLFHRKVERSEEDLDPGATPEAKAPEEAEAGAETEAQLEAPGEQPAAEPEAEAPEEPQAEEEPEEKAQPGLSGMKPLVLPKVQREFADLDPEEQEEAAEESEAEEPTEALETAETEEEPVEAEASEDQDEEEPEVGLSSVSQSILLQTQLSEEDVPAGEEQEEPETEAEPAAEQEQEPETQPQAEPEPEPEPEPVSEEPAEEPVAEPELQEALPELSRPAKTEAAAEPEPEPAVTAQSTGEEPSAEEAPAAKPAPASPVRRKFDPSRVKPAPAVADLASAAQYSMWMEDPFISSPTPEPGATESGIVEPLDKAPEPDPEAEFKPEAGAEAAAEAEAEDRADLAPLEETGEPEGAAAAELAGSEIKEPEPEETDAAETEDEEDEFLAYQEDSTAQTAEPPKEEKPESATAEASDLEEDDEDEFAAYMPDFSLRRPDLPKSEEAEVEEKEEPELEMTSGMGADLTMIPGDEEAQESTIPEGEQPAAPEEPGTEDVHTEELVDFAGEAPDSVRLSWLGAPEATEQNGEGAEPGEAPGGFETLGITGGFEGEHPPGGTTDEPETGGESQSQSQPEPAVAEPARDEEEEEPVALGEGAPDGFAEPEAAGEAVEGSDLPQIRDVPGSAEDEEEAAMEPSRPTNGEARVPEVEEALSAPLAGEAAESADQEKASEGTDKLSSLLNRLVANQDDEEEREELAEAVADAAQEAGGAEGQAPPDVAVGGKQGAAFSRGRVLMPLSRLTSVLPEEIQSLLEDENLDFEVALPIENLIQAREEAKQPSEREPSFEALKKFFAGITRKEDDPHQVKRAEAVTTVALTFATLIENVSVETVERYFEKVPGTTIVEIPSQLIAQQTEGPLFFLTGSQLTSLLPQELRGEVHVGDHVRLEVPITEVVNDLPRQILAQLLEAQLRHRRQEELDEQNEVERESQLPSIPPRPRDLEDRRRTTPRF